MSMCVTGSACQNAAMLPLLAAGNMGRLMLIGGLLF